ncbi:hypothetical protein FACS189447_07700 [Spirochaetia bacterium]|nr:hypothetical protein FACS189447_07700 [Spirochaetia bacterium]
MKIIVNSQTEAISLSGQLTRMARTILESKIDSIIKTAIGTVFCQLIDSITIPEEKDERLMGMTQGIALACGQVCEYGHPEIAKDILGAANMLSKAELIKNNVDNFDIEKLAEVLEA